MSLHASHWTLRSPAGYEAPAVHAVCRNGPYSDDYRTACGMKATAWPRIRGIGRDLAHVTCGRCLRSLGRSA
jgi:hypothetical protein